MAESHDFYQAQVRDTLQELIRRCRTARAASTWTDSPVHEKRLSDYASAGTPHEIHAWKLLYLLDQNGQLDLLTNLAGRLTGGQHDHCPLDRVQESVIAGTAALHEVKEARADGEWKPHEIRAMSAAAAENLQRAQETLDAVKALQPGPVAVSGEPEAA